MKVLFILTLALFLSVAIVDAANVDVDWSFGMTQSSIQVDEGDTVTFKYAGNHNVYQFSSSTAFDSCDFMSASEVDVTGFNLEFQLTFDSAGTFWFGCELVDHCPSGNMKVQVTVTTKGPSAKCINKLTNKCCMKAKKKKQKKCVKRGAKNKCSSVTFKDIGC
jgi:plastocyanin